MTEDEPGGDEASPPAAAVPARCWRFAADRQKCYFIAFRTTTPSLARRLKAWLWYHELACVGVYRLGQLSLSLLERSRLLGALPFLAYAVLNQLMRVVFHVELPLRARIGPGFHLGHPYTVIIGPTTIGANCNVTHNVTIGMGFGASGVGIPVIGDEVWIGPGATLTGPITVGDGAAIAPGAIVSRDVPPGALVAGNPARVVQLGYDNRALIDFTLPETLGGRRGPAAS